MDSLQRRLDETIVSLVKKGYLQLNFAMMVNSLNPILDFECRFEKCPDYVFQCSTAIDRLIRINEKHSDVGGKDNIESCRPFEKNTYTMVTEGGQSISPFESKSS